MPYDTVHSLSNRGRWWLHIGFVVSGTSEVLESHRDIGDLLHLSGSGEFMRSWPASAQLFRIEIEPMGAVRMTRKGKWVSEAAQRYLTYKDKIGWDIRTQMCELETTKKLVVVNVIFYMPIPNSWTKKQKTEAPGEYHTSKPDIDNLVKGLFDAVNGILWADDKQVVRVNATKVYGEKPGFLMEVEEIA